MFKHSNNIITLGVDIGGSHVSAALVDGTGKILENTLNKQKIDTSKKSNQIIKEWAQTLENTLSKKTSYNLRGIGIAMPGPFDYVNGICLMSGVNKYHNLYGINIKEALKNQLNLEGDVPIFFENDAACFGLGESYLEAAEYKKVIAITLGTGFGATFIENNTLLKEGKGVPENGYLYNVPFKNGIAEDYISSIWIRNEYHQLTGENENLTVKEIAEKALTTEDKKAIQVFEIFGENLAICLLPWIKLFTAECIVIGGSIAKSSFLFLPMLTKTLEESKINIPIKISKQMELAAITGAAKLVNTSEIKEDKKVSDNSAWRKTTQPLMPQSTHNIKPESGKYNIYPFFELPLGEIFPGYNSLAQWIITNKVVIIDGYIGNDWKAIQQHLSFAFKQSSVNVLWYETSAFLLSEKNIDELTKPFLGTEGSVWGKKTTLSLADFYQKDKLENLQPDVEFDVNILIGTGAALANWNAPVVYVDIPKNEIQYRMRANNIFNLGKTAPEDFTEMYKRFYFVDWPVMNKHREKIKNRIEVIADGQWKDNISWAFGTAMEEGFRAITHSIMRVRPWFEAGAWGGQWMKEHIPYLNKNEINYAWSFELIVPENGLVFEKNGNLLEVAFDWLMGYDSKAILGKDAAKFGTEFPIRFDFLDTFDGGNLSIQCHPRLQYIQQEFGENITQDETYYILDCKDNASVYLGFQENIDAGNFRKELEKSVAENTAIEIENYVQVHPAHKHDLFLIPNSTIHGSGINNMVLEISATPYIFTFKMYDWVRLDLNGEPRPINIEHAFKNLDFNRKGEKVKQELISRPVILERTDHYQLVHLPTHAEHFYDVHRIEFLHEIKVSTSNQCHILMLVEGESIVVTTDNGYSQEFNYAETFIIPAAAGGYHILNKGKEMAKVVKAFIK